MRLKLLKKLQSRQHCLCFLKDKFYFIPTFAATLVKICPKNFFITLLFWIFIQLWTNEKFLNTTYYNMQNSFQFMISIIFSRIIKMELLRGLLILKSGGKNISSHGQKIGMPYTFSFFLNSFGWNLICHEKLQSRRISSKLIKKEQTKSLILKATIGTFIFYPDFMLCLTAVVHLTSFEKK